MFLSWALDPPLPTIIHRAMSLLTSIGACVEGETLTPLGHHLAALPVHVRIGKMLLYAAILGCLEPIVSICRVRRFHTSYPPVLSTHPIHPSYPPVLSTHPIHPSYPHVLSTHPSYPHVLSPLRGLGCRTSGYFELCNVMSRMSRDFDNSCALIVLNKLET